MANNFLALSGSVMLSGSLQMSGGDMTGNLIGTASHATYAENLTVSSLTLADLTITNTASIEYLNVVYQSSSVIYSSGSNIFGDSPSDTQTLHGQVEILNDAHIYGVLQVDGGVSGNITGSLLGNVVGNADTATSASHAGLADNAQYSISGSYAATSDLAQYSISGSYAATSDMAQYSISGSHSANADYAQAAISSSHALNSDYAQSAVSASNSLEANHALNADTASYVVGGVTLQGVLPGEVLFAGPSGEITGSQTFTYDWANGVSIQSDADIIISASGETEIQGRDFRVDVTDDIRMFGFDSFFLANRSATDPISIYTDYDNNSYRFEFEANGNLQMPYLLDGTRGQMIGTASHALYADNFTGNSLTLADLTITNTASIEYLNVVYQSSSVIYSSGSNIFGDASDDTQTLYGQVEILNNAHVYGTLEVSDGISGNITGSLQGNASTATSASHALVADVATNSSAATSASYADIANLAYTANNATNASFASTAGNASFASAALSASWAATASYALSVADVAFNREWHVSSGSGNDITGNGSLSKPFQTLTKALTLAGGTGELIVVHPGTYRESVTITQSNLTIQGPQNAGGISYISGSVTVATSNANASVRMVGLMANNIIHNNVSRLYARDVVIQNSIVKSGNSAYSEYDNVNCQAAGGISITGAGTVIFEGNNIALVTVNNASAAVFVKDALSCTGVTVTAGTFVADNSILYPLASGSAAITSAAGSIVYLYNTNVTTTTGLPERISIGGFLGYDDALFNKNLSTLGTSLNLRANFQSLDANNLTATGSLFGTASWSRNAVSASWAPTNPSTVFFSNNGISHTSSSFSNGKVEISTINSIDGINSNMTVNPLDMGGVQVGVTKNDGSVDIYGNWEVFPDIVSTLVGDNATGDASGVVIQKNQVIVNGNNRIELLVNDPAGAVEVTGSLKVTGKINFLNLPNYADDVTAAAGGVEIGDLYRNGNFVVIRIS